MNSQEHVSHMSPKMFRVSQGSILAPGLMNGFISEVDRNTDGKPTKFSNNTEVKESLGTE